jgi:cytochrome c oxidase cbb3-type subunit III
VRIPLLLAASGCLVAAVLARESTLEGRLLRADPNALPDNPMLMGFARERGEALFEIHCAACHGFRGEADPARGVPGLADHEWLYGTGVVSDTEQIIKYGIRSYHPKTWNLAIMPAYATPHPSRDANIKPLSPANIQDLVDFLQAKQGRESADPMAAARGARLFTGPGGCYDCHAADAGGDPAIGAPNLTAPSALYGSDAESLTMSISYGRHGMCPAWVGRITAAGIRETAIYVYSLSHPGGGGS